MPVSIDLRKAHKFQRHGDMIVVLTWVNDERSLVLLPAHRRSTGWYIVQESAAHKWGVDHQDQDLRRAAMEHVVTQSTIACSMLDIEATKANRARVISIITGWLPDLIRMPAAPPVEFSGASLGEMILRADGKPMAAEDVRVEANQGATYG